MITERQIYMISESPKVISEATELINNQQVKNLKLSNEKFEADVELYHSEIEFNRSQIQNFTCTCKMAKFPNKACKHIVATIKQANNEIEKYRLESERIEKITNDIVDSFTHDTFSENIIKQQLTLTKILDISGNQPKLVFKIGIGKTYIVKDIIELLEAFNYEEEVEYSDTFTLNPYYQKLSEIDERLLNLISEINETMPQLIYNRYILLNDLYLKKILKLLAGEKINLKSAEGGYENIEIVTDKFNHPIKIQYIDHQIYLDIKVIHRILPLTDDLEYVFYNNFIYRLSRHARYQLKPFIEAARNGLYVIPYTDKKKDEFINRVIPCLPSNVELPDSLLEEIIQYPLKAKLYLDKQESSIVATPTFQYGFYEFNAMENPESIILDGKYLIRQLNKEEQLMSLFDLANFKVGKNNLYIDNQEEVLEFVNTYLPIMQENMEVFYSDSFKTIIRHKTLNYSMKFNEESQLFDISFSYEGILKSDFKNILKSYRLKQKYYRLSDGSFISLDDENTKKVIDSLSYMNIKPDDLGKSKLSINKNQAFILNTQIDLSNSDAYFKELLDCIKRREKIEFKQPPEINAELRDYQITGYQWYKTMNYYQFGGILADDMGLGKTLQTLTFIKDEAKHSVLPNMVVCPSSLIYNWEDEIKKFVPDLKYLIVTGNQNVRRNLISEVNQYNLIITSYPLLRNDYPYYNGIQFNHLFLDEAQNIKNPTSLNARCAKMIQANTKFALTGTPIENSLSELWSIFDFIMPGMLLNRRQFRENYEKPILLDHNKAISDLLAKRIQPFVLRRMKTDVLTELPEKTETKYTIELTDKQKMIYLDLLAQTRQDLSKEFKEFGYEKSQIKIISAITRLRQVCNDPSLFIENYTGGSCKIDALKEIISQARSSNQKILIFSQFVAMLNIIKDQLELEEIPYYFLDGNTPSKERVEMVDQFNNDDTPIFLISLKAGGTGLNLTGASIVIHVDPWWNPAVENQATDRAYRIGQTKNVQVFKLITRGTIEEKIYDMQQKKMDLTSSVIKDGETFINHLSEEELMNLLL